MDGHLQAVLLQTVGRRAWRAGAAVPTVGQSRVSPAAPSRARAGSFPPFPFEDRCYAMKIAAVALLSLGAYCRLLQTGERPAPATCLPRPPYVTQIVVGLDDNFPPMGFRDEERVGRLRHRAWPGAAKRLERKVEFKPIDWSAKGGRAVEQARGRVLWNGLTITERKQNIAFTAPTMENHRIIVGSPPAPSSRPRPTWPARSIGAQENPAPWTRSRGRRGVQVVQRDSRPSATT